MSIRGRSSCKFLNNLVVAQTKPGIATWAVMVVSALWPCHPALAQELSVDLQIQPRVQKGRISPYIFGAGIDAKTNPLRAPKYPEQVFRECHEVVNALIKARCKQQPPPKLIVGEWSADWTAGIFPQHVNSVRGSLMRTLATAVFMSDHLLYMLQKSVPEENIHAAFWHTFSNDAQALFSIQTSREQGLAYKGKSTDEGYGYRMPIYWTFKLLSEQRGEFLVESRLQGNNSIDAPKPGLNFDPEYSFDRVTHCASVSGDRLYVALLNKDANQSVETHIDIQDWPRKTAVEVHEVRADSYLAENTIERPDTVKLADPQIVELAQTGTVTYRLKPNSLIVLRFEGAGSE